MSKILLSLIRSAAGMAGKRLTFRTEWEDLLVIPILVVWGLIMLWAWL
jgi:hypothetical protein